jgi:hypothetical protein
MALQKILSPEARAKAGAGAGIRKAKVKSMMMPNLRPHFLRLLRPPFTASSPLEIVENQYYPKLCRSLGQRSQKMVLGTSLPEFNPDKFHLL